MVPLDRDAVRRALAGSPVPLARGRSTRIGWLIGLVALGVTFGMRSLDPSEPPRAEPSTATATSGLRRARMEISAALHRDPVRGGARAATIAFDVVWQDGTFDLETGRHAATEWLATMTSGELIAAAGGAERGLRAALIPSTTATLFAIDWQRLELR